MSEQPIAHQTVRFTFPTMLAAAQALLMVLNDARTTERVYRFTGLSPAKILRSGLVLEGDVADTVKQVERIAGAVRQDT